MAENDAAMSEEDKMAAEWAAALNESKPAGEGGSEEVADSAPRPGSGVQAVRAASLQRRIMSAAGAARREDNHQAICDRPARRGKGR